MFEKLTTAHELFIFKLGSALSMEQDSLQMLEDLTSRAQRVELKELLEEHTAETRQQLANLQRAFELLGEDIDDSPSPTTAGLAKEGKTTLRKTIPQLADQVILAGALETEHYEIAVYETLIAAALAEGRTELVSIFEQNLGQEKAAAEKLRAASREVAAQGPVHSPEDETI
ncbi:ferritin-like domain-containing protein [Arthrobacter sp. A5]|uniref:YciE/YciF ferroxidase family protein n=1 Tax=Arthrobacter sp. A5 TaxID=576926 RepID=UPI003DA83078